MSIKPIIIHPLVLDETKEYTSRNCSEITYDSKSNYHLLRLVGGHFLYMLELVPGIARNCAWTNHG